MVFRSHGAGDFDPEALAAAKQALDLSVSVCLPARDEAATVGAIVESIAEELVSGPALVDEVVVVDDGSRDATATRAAAAGATVFAARDILPEAGVGRGKGNALWKSLQVSTGDVVCWVDADIRAFDASFVVGLVGPLLTRPEIDFVKGFYDRPLGDAPGEGGRVTELVARPLLSRFFPRAALIAQPLGGEYAGRRELLETLPFVEGWGVDVALLIDVIERGGAESVAQVDLGVRAHRNRPLRELGLPAAEILATVLGRAGLCDAGSGHELVRLDEDDRIEHLPVSLRQRPPIVEVPAYRSRAGREMTA